MFVRNFALFLSMAAAAAAQTPTVTNVQNNYSFIQPFSPNYGIAQGSLMLISGTNLVTTSNVSESFPLQQSLNGTSVAVTVNGTTTNPYLYYVYASGAQSYIGAVLPSATPVGNASMVVTNNGKVSGAFKFQVVQTSVGLDTLYGAAVGRAVAQDGSGNLLSNTNAANPNQTIVLWGSGVGPDTANSNEGLLPQKQDNLLNLPLEVDIGGIQAHVAYQGRSQFPGVDQINVVIPPNVQAGCYVSVVAWTGNYMSNFATLPIAASGTTCSDAVGGYTLTAYQDVNTSNGHSDLAPMNISYALAAMAESQPGPFNVGSIILEEDNAPPGQTLFGIPFPPTQAAATAVMSRYTGAQLNADLNPYLISAGSCTVAPFQIDPGSATLDAGPQITLTGPNGSQGSALTQPGYSQGQDPAFLTAGTYTFASTGGADVKQFSASTTFAPFVWNEMDTDTSVSRSAPLTVTWSGGAPNSLVLITGASYAGADQGGTKFFYCLAPVSAQKFTVPVSVLMSLPYTASLDGLNSSAYLAVSNSSPPASFSASGLQLGVAASIVFNNTSIVGQTFMWF